MVYLYTRRYFPSRPLSESETSKQQDTGIPLLCLFTSPAGGAQDRRAARACTSVTCNEDGRYGAGGGGGLQHQYCSFSASWRSKTKHLNEQRGRNRPLDIPACFIESARERMDVYGDLKLRHVVAEPASSHLVQSAAIPDSISTNWATTVPRGCHAEGPCQAGRRGGGQTATGLFPRRIVHLLEIT